MISADLRNLASALRPGNPLGLHRGLSAELVANLANLLDMYAASAETLEQAAVAPVLREAANPWEVYSTSVVFLGGAKGDQP